MEFKAISIKQPWAWFICNFQGLSRLIPPKRIENRSRLKNLSGIHLVHSGKKFDQEGYQWIAEMFDEKGALKYFKIAIPRPGDFNLGGVVGWLDFKGVSVTKSNDIWFSGPNGLLIDSAGWLPFFACNGSQGIFKVDYPDKDLWKTAQVNVLADAMMVAIHRIFQI